MSLYIKCSPQWKQAALWTNHSGRASQLPHTREPPENAVQPNGARFLEEYPLSWIFTGMTIVKAFRWQCQTTERANCQDNQKQHQCLVGMHVL